MIYSEDNFFNDPYKVRKIALQQRYSKPISYPGLRSDNITGWIDDYILSRMRHITNYPNLKVRSTRFQYITKQFGDGIFHYDSAQYICIAYLSPTPPVNTGTEVCDFDQVPDTLNTSEVIHLKESFHNDPSNLIKRYRYARIRKKLNSYYNPLMKVPNKFNRIVMFPANYFHRAQNFFGTSIQTSRLTLVSFFDK
tara:strand:- start:44 stop:628 length:585 start_codon:yes stop_codon:yes gene_type:complete